MIPVKNSLMVNPGKKGPSGRIIYFKISAIAPTVPVNKGPQNIAHGATAKDEKEITRICEILILKAPNKVFKAVIIAATQILRTLLNSFNDAFHKESLGVVAKSFITFSIIKTSFSAIAYEKRGRFFFIGNSGMRNMHRKLYTQFFANLTTPRSEST